jgi:plastocyanin
MCITWYFSRSLETRGTDSASVFLSGSSVVEIVGLYAGKADPTTVSIKAGDSVEFLVKDDSRHYIAERRSESRRGDARISSGEFGPGESYSIQFNTPGSFSFYDRMNQDISIDIEVR